MKLFGNAKARQTDIEDITGKPFKANDGFYHQATCNGRCGAVAGCAPQWQPDEIRVMANGHDVTAQMPRTAATLNRIKEAEPSRQAAPVEAPAYKQTNDDPLKLGGPVPQSMGRTADLYADIRALRLAMDKEVAEVKARETELREYIINNLSKSADTGAAGLRYRAQIVMKDMPRPENWELIHGYIRESGRFDLLQRRLGEKAVMDMVEAGEQIPGVEVVHIPDVSITKI